MTYSRVTLTTEEWKAEQQLFLGEDEEHKPLVAYNQQAVPVSFLLHRCSSRQGPAGVQRHTSANSQVLIYTVTAAWPGSQLKPLALLLLHASRDDRSIGWRV